MKTAIFSISGISCNKCVQEIETTLSSVIQLASIKVFRNPDRIEVSSQQTFDVKELQIIFKESGLSKYTIQDFSHRPLQKDQPDQQKAFSKISRLFPLFLIVSYLLMMTLTIAFVTSNFSPMNLMSHYMAGFFLTFSFFKFLNLKRVF